MADDRALSAAGTADTPTRVPDPVAMLPTGTIRTLLVGAAVMLAYVGTGELGLRLAVVAEQVTTVWAPTGIAIAALLLWGRHLWPAIWLGAFLVNVRTDVPAWTAALMASGNTLEAVVAVVALHRVRQFEPALHRVSDVLAFAGIAAFACTMVSATIGVLALCVGGVQPWSRVGTLWFDWWFGDALGALIVAPALLTTVRRPPAQWLRTAAVVVGAGVVTYFVFARFHGSGTHPLEYVVFPTVMAAAVYGGPPTAALSVVGASVVSIWKTVEGAGPFAGAEIHQSLILLQTFMAVLAATALLLAAAIAEREASEQREKDAALVLRHRDEMLRIAQRAGGVATFEWDFTNQVSICSAEFFRIFGLPDREGLMHADEWARFVHPDDRERLASHLDAALKGLAPAVADYRIVLADGSVRWLSYAGQLQHMSDGTARMLGTVLDITERKRTELELQEAKNAAESANRLKDQFLATLSHELRTPLNAILGYARMLQTNAVASERRQHAVDVIERNALAQQQLIEDLLDMSRITTGTVRLDPEPVPLTAVLLDAVEGIRPAADARQIILHLELDHSAGTVTADRSRLQQVFWNLLTNAVKFTNTNGTVAIVARRDDSHVEVSVIDTGIGIPPHFLPYVFDPFRQGDATLARGHSGGLGLGLAISRQLVELHGGTIHAASDGEGRGATFVVRLPRYSE